MRLVIALGGNALLDPSQDLSYAAQEDQIRETTGRIAAICQEHEVVLVHGNGPQVGALMAEQHGSDFERPLDALVAETQGQLGYLLQRGLQAEGVDVGTAVTQVQVDPDDPAFDDPSKPVGPFLDEETAAAAPGTYRELGSGDRPYRRVVPSPEPKAIKETAQIQGQLERAGTVIACGGGGIPVDADGNGVEAVIDKDQAASEMAIEVGADRLIVLTDVDHAYTDYPDNTTPIEETRPSRLQDHLTDGTFGEGSMRPKVEAAIRFAEATGNRATIGSVDHPREVLNGTGTTVTPD